MKTRTLWWFVGAAAVSAWAVAFLSADYVCRRPDSWAGRFLRGVYQAAATYNPVSVISQVAAGGAHPGCQVEAPTTSCQPLAPNCHDEASPEAVEPLPIETINLPRIQVEAAQAHDEDEAVRQVAATEPPEDANDLPDAMPPCVDEHENVPLHMTHADEAAECQEVDGQTWLVNFWRMLFGGAGVEPKEKLPTFARPAGGEEESELVPGGKAPLLRESPAIHQQYPGCPFMERCPGATRPVPSAPKSLKDDKSYDLNSLGRRLGADADDSEECEDHPKQPDVDTMEFRPSDAKLGEFDPKPF